MPRGGALKADQLQRVLENTYKETDDAPTGYSLDRDLSDDRVKVYKDMNSDQVIVAHRGSKGFRDWLDNARYAYSGDIKTSGTYQDAKSRQKKAIDKYGAQNIISVGHSRAGKYVEELNKEQPVKEVITYNKAVHPNTVFQSNPENQTDVRTSTDIVSALSPFQFSKNKTLTIPSGYDLFKAHKPSALSYFGEKLIGKGFKQMRVGDMRKFIKAYKQEKYGEKMPGCARLGKKELVSMMNPILEDDDLDEMVGGSVWTDFVKEFSARHGLRYGCALSKYKDPLKKAYTLKKGGKDWVEDLVIDREDSTDKPPVITARKSKPIKPRADDVDLDEEGSLKERVAKRKENEMVDMPYKPKMTREMRFQMEKALRESTKHLPPLRSKREDALIAQQVPALKGILKGLKEKTTGLKRQAMIDLILQREGLVKGAVFDDPADYKQLEEQYRIRLDTRFQDPLDGYTLTNVRGQLSRIRNKLKEAKKAGDLRKIGNAKTEIDYYTEELKKLERLTKDDQYLISKVKTGGMVGGNRWTDFVKDYAKKNNTTYMCASSNPKTKKAYKLFKEAKPRQIDGLVRLDRLGSTPKPRQKKEVAFVPLEEAFPTEIVLKNVTIRKPEMIDMEYRPKLTRELRRALELELASKPSRLSQLPPIRGEREEELMELSIDELKDIVSDNEITTRKKTKQALIDAILKHEGEVKGTVLPEEQYNDLLELHNILKLKNKKGNRSLSVLYQNLGTQKNKLKEMRQDSRDLFAERLQMDRISKLEDYIKFAEKLLLK